MIRRKEKRTENEKRITASVARLENQKLIKGKKAPETYHEFYKVCGAGSDK